MNDTLAKIKDIYNTHHDALQARLYDVPCNEKHILVCHGPGCFSNHSDQVLEKLQQLVAKYNLSNVRVVLTGCIGLCSEGVVVVIRPDDTFYCHVEVEDCEEIITSHIMNNQVVKRLCVTEVTGLMVEKVHDLAFYKKQKRIALRNVGVVDPTKIEDYIAFDGYQALEKCLFELSRNEVVDIIRASGLRGRGGAGFPTGRKWALTAQEESDEKYVVCNADEGDPGAFMDRSILEGDPFGILEAMTICGYAIGAQKGYIYVRAEYPYAVKRLQNAIRLSREYGTLGNHIFGSDFSFDIDIRLGAGAFVCGEETALLESIEGKRGQPRVKPPYPAQRGLFGKPTVINNVETFANITKIINSGAEAFNSIGTDTSKGTKVFALGGNVNNTGLVEVPMGTTLREIIYDIGGGIPNNKQFKAAQTGGPSGGCIPAEHLNTPIDYESLAAIGSMMGSGGLIVMDETKCMVDIARFYLDFTVSESCGKCTPCRIGTKRMLEILNRICEGKADGNDLYKLEKLAHVIQNASVCGLGQTAPNPVLATLKYFRDEYNEHVYRHRCPTGTCKALSEIKIDPSSCKGCGLCAKNCPVNAISGQLKQAHFIDPSVCIKCGTCVTICPFHAINN